MSPIYMPREQPQAVIDALLKLGEQERLLSGLH